MSSSSTSSASATPSGEFTHLMVCMDRSCPLCVEYTSSPVTVERMNQNFDNHINRTLEHVDFPIPISWHSHVMLTKLESGELELKDMPPSLVALGRLIYRSGRSLQWADGRIHRLEEPHIQKLVFPCTEEPGSDDYPFVLVTMFTGRSMVQMSMTKPCSSEMVGVTLKGIREFGMENYVKYDSQVAINGLNVVPYFGSGDPNEENFEGREMFYIEDGKLRVPSTKWIEGLRLSRTKMVCSHPPIGYGSWMYQEIDVAIHGLECLREDKQNGTLDQRYHKKSRGFTFVDGSYITLVEEVPGHRGFFEIDLPEFEAYEGEFTGRIIKYHVVTGENDGVMDMFRDWPTLSDLRVDLIMRVAMFKDDKDAVRVIT